ncbi:hypothetical protein EB796_003583 [Bugula neritina]|uniref:Protein sleepless n=1 Tax=Bugula neritina TaxID=10212 RepID=A0A7J7KIQ1_BUGNE|nr:hypothetical protein EB796_003583 [Bugula neritina]
MKHSLSTLSSFFVVCALLPHILLAARRRCYECEAGDAGCRDQYTRPLAHDMTCDDLSFNACVKYIYPKAGQNDVTRGCYKIASDTVGDPTGCNTYKDGGRKYTKCVCTDGDLCNVSTVTKASLGTMLVTLALSSLC